MLTRRKEGSGNLSSTLKESTGIKRPHRNAEDDDEFDNPYATDDTNNLNINSQLAKLPDFSKISKIGNED